MEMGLGLGLTLSRGGSESPAATFEETFMSEREGAMFHANDMTLLFQDTAAETPVTAVGQSVNAMYDASGTVLLTNTGTSGGFVYRHDGANGYLEADGTGIWSSSVGLMSGLSGNFYVSYKKTVLVTAHPTRYTYFWRTADNNQALYFDYGKKTKSNLRQKTLRTDGTNNMPKINPHDTLYPAGSKIAMLAQFDTTEGSIRSNCVMYSGKANSGTGIVSIDDTVEILRQLPGDFYGFGLFSGLLNAVDMVSLEDYCLDLVGSDIVKPPLVAHKGFPACNAQNTLPAYAYTAGVGVLQWEGDLRLSADDTWHIFHDASVDTLTDGTGGFTSLSDAYIAGLSVLGSGNPPPTLAAFLSLADSLGAEKLYLEIKDAQSDADIDALVAQIAAAGWAEKMNLSSVDNANLARVRVTSSVIEIGYMGELVDWSSKLALAKANTPAAMVWSRSKIADPANDIADAHDTTGDAARIPVILWSVTSTAQALIDGANGADAVIVDSNLYAQRTDLCLP